MASNNSIIDEENSLRECESYVTRHNVQQMLKEAIVSLCVSRPENPKAFLRDHFGRLDEQVGNNLINLIVCIKSFTFVHPFLLMS